MSFPGSQFLLPVLLMSVRVVQGQGQRREGGGRRPAEPYPSLRLQGGPFPDPSPVFCSKVRPGLPLGKRLLWTGTQDESRNAPGRALPILGSQFPPYTKRGLGGSFQV